MVTYDYAAFEQSSHTLRGCEDGAKAILDGGAGS